MLNCLLAGHETEYDMGREIKRVALDFDYPINQMIWKGYHNPYNPMKCVACGGSGESPELKEISESWYDFEGTGKRWCDNITQDEVEALVEAGRLMDFTHEFISGEGWKKKEPPYIPTAEEVNEWNKKGFGHDAINRWICVKARAKRLGITKLECEVCNGKGHLWADDKFEKLWEEFESIEPPQGDGYQLWSTTTEGTPMSPVFEKPEDLATWLVDNNASSFGSQRADYETWLNFIKKDGWAPSMIGDKNGLRSGVECSS